MRQVKITCSCNLSERILKINSKVFCKILNLTEFEQCLYEERLHSASKAGNRHTAHSPKKCYTIIL